MRCLMPLEMLFSQKAFAAVTYVTVGRVLLAHVKPFGSHFRKQSSRSSHKAGSSICDCGIVAHSGC